MDELIDTIDWLQDLDEETLKIMFDGGYSMLQGLVDRKDLQSLADSLQRTPEMLTRTLEAIGFIITSISTNKPLPDIPWLGSLEKFVSDKQSEIKLKYSQNSLHNPLLSNFKSLDWRFEVQLSSRAIEDIALPKIILSIATDTQEKTIESDYANLKNMYTQLKSALKTFESVRAKKAEKFIKPSKVL